MSKVNAAVPPTANTIEKAVAMYQAGEKQKALKAVAKMHFKTCMSLSLIHI